MTNLHKRPCPQKYLFRRGSPCISCVLQLICFFLFLCLLIHVTNPQFEVYHLSWSDAVNSVVFGQDDSSDDNTFSSITDANSFYFWLNSRLIPSKCRFTKLTNTDNTGVFADPTMYQILSTPTFPLRQFRVLPDPLLCAETNHTCYGSIDKGAQQQGGTWKGTAWVAGDKDYTVKGE